MELPQMIYGPVESSAGAGPLVGRAAKQLGDTVSGGLYSLSNELVKAQSEDAALQLTTRLNNLKQQLAAREYVTADEARSALGDAAPPGVKLTEQHIDPDTGTLAERDRDMIPTYELAEPIFREQSRRIIAESSQAIGSSGWRAQFQDQAQLFAEKERERVALTSIAMMRHDLKLRAANTLDGYVTAGAFKEAYGFLSRTDALEPGEKEKALYAVEKQEELYPFRIAILDGISTPEEKARTLELVGILKGDGLEKIPPQEKAVLAATLRAQVEHYDRATTVDQFKAADDAAQNAIVGFMIRNPKAPIPFKTLEPFIGKVSPSKLEHLLGLVKSTQQAAGAVETDPAVYQHISNSITSDMEGFKNDQILVGGQRLPLLSFSGRLSKEHLIHFINLQRTVKENGAAAARGFIDDKQLVDGVLVGNFKYDLKTTDENKLGEIGFLRIQADLALTRAQAGSTTPLKAEDRLNIVRSTIASHVQTKGKTWGIIPFTGGGPEVKAVGVDPAWFAVWSGQRKRLGLDVTPAHAKEVFEHYSQFEAGFSSAWMAQTGKPFLPVETSIAIYENMTRSPKPGVIPSPVTVEIEAALEKVNPETGRPYKDASPEVVARMRAALAVVAYLKATKKAGR
jgi:hypothetical protein